MASQYGERAPGSDGSDYFHRERVADHYQMSVKWKHQLQYVLVTQIVCLLFTMGVASITHDYPSLITILGYLIGIPCCWQAVQKNSANLINIYGVCCSMLGAFPMAYTVYSFLWTGGIESYRYLRLVQGLIVIGLNGIGSFYAKQLLNLWMNPSRRKR